MPIYDRGPSKANYKNSIYYLEREQLEMLLNQLKVEDILAMLRKDYESLEDISIWEAEALYALLKSNMRDFGTWLKRKRLSIGAYVEPGEGLRMALVGLRIDSSAFQKRLDELRE